jgi:predicted double-glycine peptidase
MALAGGVVLCGCHLMDADPKKSGHQRYEDFDSGEVFTGLSNGVQIRQPVRSWRKLQRRNVVFQRFDFSCGSGALATMLRYYFQDTIPDISDPTGGLAPADRYKIPIVIQIFPGENDEAKLLRWIAASWCPPGPPPPPGTAAGRKFQRLVAENLAANLKDRIELGFSMADLQRAAAAIGYQAAVVKIPLNKLVESPAPVVVRIIKNDYKHFVVFRGVHEDTVFLADPVRGNVRLSLQEFQTQWSQEEPKGYALFLGKTGFGLPKQHPLAVAKDRAARPELDIARWAQFPLY